MPLIDRSYRTVAAIKATVSRVGVTLKIEAAAGVGSSPRIADAMRPRVVAADRHAVCGAALKGQEEAVVAGGAACIGVNDSAEVLSGLRILQAEQTALVRVAGGGARRIGDTVECARSQSKKNRRIDVVRCPQVSRAVSKVGR